MAKRKNKSPARQGRLPDSRSRSPGLRIIGGTLRGRKLRYAPQRRVRPMKDRVREAVFNLVGPSIRGKHAIDLFAGTGAIGLEAISRGATGATLVECHYPTAGVLRENITALGVEARCQVVVADTLAWLEQEPPLCTLPWVVLVSPPYDFFVARQEDMLRLIETMYERAPPESILVVESDGRFDFVLLDRPDSWDVRDYPPARVGICRKPASP